MKLLSAGYAAVKVVDIGSSDEAIDSALQVAETAGKSRAIWLELPGPLRAPERTKLVTGLAKRIDADDLPPHVVLQLNQSDEHEKLADLQAAADEAVAPSPEHPGLVVMHDIVPDALTEAAGRLGVRGVNLNPQRLGGMFAVLEIAKTLLALSPSIRIGLSTTARSFGIGARALVELGAALPRLDYLAAAPAVDIRGANVVPPLDCDSQYRIVPAEGAGLGCEADLAPAVHMISRVTESPASKTRQPEYNGQAANKFDTESLLHLANERGALRLYSPLLERSALALGLDVFRMSPRFFLVKHRDLPQPIGFLPTMTAWSGRSSYEATVDKELTRSMLRHAGVRVPRGKSFDAGNVDDAVEYAASLGGPVVVKPRNGIHGTGVSTDLRTTSDVRQALLSLQHTQYGDQDIVVEEHIPGADYRFFVVGDRVASVVLKRPASVLGDGESTIVDLVVQKNRHRLGHPHARDNLIRLGRDSRYWLERQGLSHESVPERGLLVRLGSAGNVATGGDSIEVLDETHESLLELAVKAVRAIPGVDHAGVDLMGDHRRSNDEHRAVVIEVNANPATTLNHFPLFGRPRDVSHELVSRSCTLAGLKLGRPRDKLALRIQAEGLVQGVGYRQWFARMANDQRVSGFIRNLPSGAVEALVVGATDRVWILASSAIRGPRRAVVNRVQSSHVEAADVALAEGFRILG